VALETWWDALDKREGYIKTVVEFPAYARRDG
jgi:hypothetical protein